MRCARCGNSSHDRGATTCKVCGQDLPQGNARATARSSTHYRDPRRWERHVFRRLEAAPVELPRDRDFVIGRSRECDLVLQSGRVSRNHSQLFWRDGDPILRDLGSENGTTVNGSRVHEHPLQDGDEVGVGPFLLTYRRLQVVGSVTQAKHLEESADSRADTQSMQTVAMSGRLEDLGLYEILDTLHYNARTGTVEVFTALGRQGRIGLQDGHPVYAYADDQEGEGALLTLLGWHDGTFSFSTDLQHLRPNVRAGLPDLLARYRQQA